MQSLDVATNLYVIGERFPLIVIVSEYTAPDDTGSIKLSEAEMVAGIVCTVKLPLQAPMITVPVVVRLYHELLGIMASIVLPFTTIPVLPEETTVLQE